MKEMYDVLLIEPGKHPVSTQVGTELKDLQAVVGGYVEVCYPFGESVVILSNEEGKINGMPLNRALYDSDGVLADIVAGTFMVIGVEGDSFKSLTPEQMERYANRFHQPETFVRMGGGILVIPIMDSQLENMKPEKDNHKTVKEQETR